MVKNSTGADRRAGDCIGVDYASIPLTDISNDYPWFVGKVVASGRILNAFAITLEPITNNSIGPAMSMGVCKAYVTINDALHRFAMPTAGSCALESCPANGPVRILYKPTGTGEKLCFVQVDRGYRDGVTGIATFSGALACARATATTGSIPKSTNTTSAAIRGPQGGSSPAWGAFGNASGDYVWNPTGFQYGASGADPGWSTTEVPVVLQDGIWLIDEQARRKRITGPGTDQSLGAGTWAADQVHINGDADSGRALTLPSAGMFQIEVSLTVKWGDSTARNFTSEVYLWHSTEGELDRSIIDFPLPSQTAATNAPVTTATLPSTINKRCTHKLRFGPHALPSGVIYLTATAPGPETTADVKGHLMQVRDFYSF